MSRLQFKAEKTFQALRVRLRSTDGSSTISSSVSTSAGTPQERQQTSFGRHLSSKILRNFNFVNTKSISGGSADLANPAESSIPSRKGPASHERPSSNASSEEWDCRGSSPGSFVVVTPAPRKDFPNSQKVETLGVSHISLPRLSISRYIRCTCSVCKSVPDEYFVAISGGSLSVHRRRELADTQKHRAREALDAAQMQKLGVSPDVTTATAGDHDNRVGVLLNVDPTLSCKHRSPPSDSYKKGRPPRAVLGKHAAAISDMHRRLSGYDYSKFGDAGVAEIIQMLQNTCVGEVAPTKTHRPTKSRQGSSDWIAEIVVIGTTLTTPRKALLDSLRIEHLLDCKGVEYFFVDVSLDIGEEFPDATLVRLWLERDWVLRDRRKPTKNNVFVPQILVDGVPIGGSIDLQALEADCDLDYILAREACPNCLRPRKPKAGQEYVCDSCKAPQRELVSVESLSKPQVEKMIKRTLGRRFRALRPFDAEAIQNRALLNSSSVVRDVALMNKQILC